jgi:hypothetical protein
MTKPQVEVITSVQRRRRWSREEKERIVAGGRSLPRQSPISGDRKGTTGLATVPMKSLWQFLSGLAFSHLNVPVPTRKNTQSMRIGSFSYPNGLPIGAKDRIRYIFAILSC